MTYKTPEVFAVGETVVRLNGKEYTDVRVISVDGDEVRVIGPFGRQMIFNAQADGQHVSQVQEEFISRFDEEFEVKSDIIFHKVVLPPVQETIFTRAYSQAKEMYVTLVNFPFVARALKFFN